MRRTLTGVRAVITGASSGIGMALANQLAGHNTKLLVTARREERLQALVEDLSRQGSLALQVVGDVTSPETRNQIVSRVQHEWQALDLLINNAGIGAIGPFAGAAPDRLQRIMEVNFFAAAELTRAFLPLLQRGRAPMIVNIGSVLGHRAVPMKSEYCASKFAVHGFFDALRAELHAEGIDVLHVCPSTTKSEFFDSLIEDTGQAAAHPGSAPDVVARKTLRAIERGKQELILTAGGKALVWVDRLMPTLANYLVRRFG